MDAEFGTVDFVHSAIDKLRFFEDKPCKKEVQFSFDLAEKDLPELLYNRSEDGFDGGQIEGDLVLKYKQKADGEEVEAVTLKLTIVHRVGDKKYFHATRDYMKEFNLELKNLGSGMQAGVLMFWVFKTFAGLEDVRGGCDGWWRC